MSQITIADPDKVERTEVNDSGTVYVGQEYSGDTVEIVVNKEGSAE